MHMNITHWYFIYFSKHIRLFKYSMSYNVRSMFKRVDLERIWNVSNDVRRQRPTTYGQLVGIERLAVLRLLDEPIQSIMHGILQHKVPKHTQCTYSGCEGTLDARGHCSEDCSVYGINVVDDIIHCLNCDRYGFPCTTCSVAVFHGQLSMNMEDYWYDYEVVCRGSRGF